MFCPSHSFSSPSLMASIRTDAEIDAASAASSLSARRLSVTTSEQSTTHTATTSEEDGTTRLVDKSPFIGATSPSAVPFPVLLHIAGPLMSASTILTHGEPTVAKDASASEIDSLRAQALPQVGGLADDSSSLLPPRPSRFVELFDHADLVTGARLVYIPHPKSHSLVPAFQPLQKQHPTPHAQPASSPVPIPVGGSDDEVPVVPAYIPQSERPSSPPPLLPPRSPLRGPLVPLRSPTSSINSIMLLSTPTTPAYDEREQPPSPNHLPASTIAAGESLDSTTTSTSPLASIPSTSQPEAGPSRSLRSSSPHPLASAEPSFIPRTGSPSGLRSQSPLSVASTTTRKRFSLSFVDRTHVSTSQPMEASTSSPTSSSPPHSPTTVASSVFGRARTRARTGSADPDHENDKPARRASISRFTASIHHHLSSFTPSLRSTSPSPPLSQISSSPRSSSTPLHSIVAQSGALTGAHYAGEDSERHGSLTRSPAASRPSSPTRQPTTTSSHGTDPAANLSPRPPHWSSFLRNGTGGSSETSSMRSRSQRRRRSSPSDGTRPNSVVSIGSSVMAPPTPVRSHSTPAPNSSHPHTPLPPSLLNETMRSASVAASRPSDPTIRAAKSWLWDRDAESTTASSRSRRPGMGPRKLSKPSDAQVLREWEQKQRESAGRPRSFVSKLFAHAE